MSTERMRRRIDRLLDDVEAAVDQRDWPLVVELSEQILLMDTENEDARAFIGLATQAGQHTNDDAHSPAETSIAPVIPVFPVAKTREQPSSFADGRYQVQRFLGEGGKKMVYLAQDTLLDRDVALALIKTEGLDDYSRTRVSREAQAMGRLSSHPHIVTVFDLSEDEHQLFMVTELMGGGDVAAILQDAEGGKLPLEQAIAIAIEICLGLEFAHAQGIIHRDLKPGNIMMTSDGVAKIGDFGLAVASDRSRITAEGMMVGTVSYMPPEQAMGSDVTLKADLYSFGAMLYEMVCGRPPFLGDDNIAIIGQHINTQPVAPTWHRLDCPRPLGTLIMRLLSKSPLDRPDSASDVRAALESIDLSRSRESIVEPVQTANILDSLAGDVFVGRQREMNGLKSALGDVLGGRGRMVTLVGEPGIGKTRTAEALAIFASLRGAQTYWGRCHESRGAPSYWPWVQFIRSYVQDHEPWQIQSEMGSGAADIAEMVPEIKEQLPELGPAAPLGDAEQQRFRLFDSITTFLKNASRSQPLVIILDNLHWADKPSLLLLEFLTPAIADSRLLVIGTYRNIGLSRHHPLVETLGEISRERFFERIILGGLTEDDTRNFIEIVSGVTPPPGLVRTVYEQTEGNSLFLTEIIRLLAQEGELTPENAGRASWDVRIPDGVREVIGRRLNRLTDHCNQTLTMSAVIGREFDLRQLVRLVEDSSENNLIDVLDEGLSARIIEEMPKTVGRYQFTHTLIQQTILDELSTSRRSSLHARVIERFEESYGADVESHATELAYHAVEAQAMIGSASLIKYSIMAGEQALERYGWEDALRYFHQADEAKDDSVMDEQSARLLFGLARAQIATLPEHREIEAIPNLFTAFAFYASSGNIERAVAVAEYHYPIRGGDKTAADELIPRALALVPPDSALAGRLLGRFGLVQGMSNGDYEGAMKTFSDALEIARSVGSVLLEMTTLTSSAAVGTFHFQTEDVFDATQRVIGMSSHIGVPLFESINHYQRGFNMMATGELQNARHHMGLSLSLSEQIKHRYRTAISAAVSGAICMLEGNFEDARQFMDRAGSLNSQDNVVLLFGLIMESTLGEFATANEKIDTLLEVKNLTSPGPNIEYAIPAFIIPFVARMNGDLSQLQIAKECGDIAVSSPHVTPLVELMARVGLTFRAYLINDEREAREQYLAMTELRKLTPFGVISEDRMLGLLAHTMGEFDISQSHFDDATAFCRNAGYVTELAWCLHDHADMLVKRNETGDLSKLRELVDEAYEITSDIGMKPLCEKVEAIRERLDARPASKPQYPEGLT